MSVFAAVERDLAAIALRSPELAESALAATALALAVEMDGPNSATSKSMCGRTLLDVLTRLRELAPEPAKESPLDEIRARRDRKAAGIAASEDRGDTGRKGAPRQ